MEMRRISFGLVCSFFLFQSLLQSMQAHGQETLKKLKGLNFSVVVNNDTHTIYRSSKLGAKGLAILKAHLRAKGLPFPKTIIYMNSDGYRKKFPLYGEFAVEEYLLQKRYGYKFYHSYDYSNRTYVDGHNPYHPTENIDQAKNLSPYARKLFSFRHEPRKDGGIESFINVLKIVLAKENQPVLFHCLGGRHRTGMVGLAIRYLQGGAWVHGPKRRAFIPLKLRRLWLNPAEYEYAFFNKDLFRSTNLSFIRRFSQDERFLSLQSHFQKELNLSVSGMNQLQEIQDTQEAQVGMDEDEEYEIDDVSREEDLLITEDVS